MQRHKKGQKQKKNSRERSTAKRLVLYCLCLQGVILEPFPAGSRFYLWGTYSKCNWENNFEETELKERRREEKDKSKFQRPWCFLLGAWPPSSPLWPRSKCTFGKGERKIVLTSSLRLMTNRWIRVWILWVVKACLFPVIEQFYCSGLCYTVALNEELQ